MSLFNPWNGTRKICNFNENSTLQLCRLREDVFLCIFWFTIIFCDKDLGNIDQEIFSLQVLMTWLSLQLSFIQMLIQGCQWLLCCLLDLGEFYLLGELYSWFLSWWFFVYIFWLGERRYFTFTDTLIHCSKFPYHSLVFHFFWNLCMIAWNHLLLFYWMLLYQFLVNMTFLEPLPFFYIYNSIYMTD